MRTPWVTRGEFLAACRSMQDELDDHLDAINSAGREHADVREALTELDEKIERLAGRIDEVFILLGADSALTREEAALEAFLQSRRTLSEVAVFLQCSVPVAEQRLRVLHLKGKPVYAGSDGFTVNGACVNNVSLNNYF